ncbi:MAG: TonB-dependent receptor [Bacteroidetes bacterium]|nr:TonB-dependent receptor [Bacteroidota bacterium]
MAKKFLLVIGILLLSVSFTITAQQQYSYSGAVHSSDGGPLPGVNVIEKGTTNGTMTDINGKFLLHSSNASLVLTLSMVGYTTYEKEMKQGETVDIALVENIIGLEEVIVIGYGTQKRANVTGAIANLNAKQLTEVPVATVNEALQGRLTGVSVTNNSGSPGSGLKVVIRGVGTNGSAQPLYVVDGIRTGDIDNVEPYDVESVEVLKDAASAAIYGADAANGVILITTKKGVKTTGTGTGLVSYNFQIGTQSIGKYTHPMDASSYATWVNEANVGVEIPTNSSINTSWMDEIQQNAMQQRHHLSFSRATNLGSYYISGSYMNQDGVVGGDKSNLERFTLRTNVTQQVKNWLKVGTNLTYYHFRRNAITEDDEFGGLIASALMLDPLTPVIYEGALSDNAQSALDQGYTLVQNGDGKYYGVSDYVKGEIANPLAQLEIAKGSTKQDKFMGNIYAILGGAAWKGFSLTTRASVDVANQLFHTWYPSFWFSSERMNTQANVRDNTDTWSTWMLENFVTYDSIFNNKHHINVIAGMSAQQYTHKYLTTISGPIFAEDDNFAEHGDVEVDGKVSGSLRDDRLVSYFGRASYEYDGRYLLSFVFRRDGTSLLGTDNRWGNFPSVSAGWIVTGEDFWNVDFVDFLKIRASWGQNGMLSGLGPDQFRALITTSGIKYPKPGGGFYTGAEPELLANPELVWATSEQVDIGLDMYMWANRLSFGFDYFNKTTKDLLTPGTPPLSVGNYAPFVNAGDVTNKGVEFEIGLRKYESAFKYDMNFNLTWLNNEVTYLNPLLDRVQGNSVGTGWTATWLELNQPVWYFRGYKTDGIFQNQQQIDAYKEANGGLAGYNPVPGDPVVVNTNGDNLINDEDQTSIGDPHPHFMWGAIFNFAYHGFDLRLFLQGVHGQDILLGWNRYDRSTSNRPQFFFDDRWTGEGSTNERPRADQSNPFIYNSDLMVYKGSYVRIKQIQLGYTLPGKVMDKMKIQNLRFYVSLDDFFTFTNYPGMDPEAGSPDDNSQGIDRGLYPTPRTFLFGLSCSF